VTSFDDIKKEKPLREKPQSVDMTSSKYGHAAKNYESKPKTAEAKQPAPSSTKSPF